MRRGLQSGTVTQWRDLGLKLSLAGLVISAIFINAGFWAAVYGVKGLADVLATSTVIAGALTGLALAAAIFCHIQKLSAAGRHTG
ncbi:MAG: hypothetical protein ACE5IA_05620 [Dehalococcoidia bacterium]